MVTQEPAEKSARLLDRVTRLLLGICLALAFTLGASSLWLGHKARETAMMMETFPWLNNKRCAARLAEAPVSGEAFRFAVFGDVQIGTAQLPRLFATLATEQPVAFIMQTGDAVSHAEPGYYDLFLYRLANCNLTVPMFVVPGNHDVRGDSTGLFVRYFGPRELAFTFGNSLFVLLDNSLKPFDDNQYLWLEGILQNHSNVQHRFLFMHSKPIHWEGDGKSTVEDRYGRLFYLLSKYKVDYIFTGDWHGYHREKRDNTCIIVNGRGGDFDHDAQMVPCYLTMVQVDGKTVTDKHFELSPKVSVVARSYLNSWLIAHLGEAMVKRPGLTIVLLLVIAGSSILCIVSSFHNSGGS